MDWNKKFGLYKYLIKAPITRQIKGYRMYGMDSKLKLKLKNF